MLSCGAGGLFALAQFRGSGKHYHATMASVVFRCPNVGIHVHGWVADDGAEIDENVYDSIMCNACRQVHLVNRATGRVLGADSDE